MIATNVPRARTSFVGRDAELRSVAQALERGRRLVTLVGPGGVGKSRLAMELIRARGRRFEGGAWLCELDAARDLTDVTMRVAAALCEDAGTSSAGLERALERRPPTLLALDNVEHLLELGITAVVQRWLDVAPDLTIVVTSQAPLAMEGEMIHRVDPLGPDEALALFVARAADVLPALELERHRASFAELATRLDRLPLAIELAASRMAVMSPDDILQRLGDRFTILRSHRRDVDPRHATLEATIDWAYGLLDAGLRDALGACAVFRGGFGLDAAEAVLPAGTSGALDALQRLVERSLVAVELHGARRRFRMLESIRAYVTARGLPADAVRRHERFYLDRHAPDRGASLSRAAWDAVELRSILERTGGEHPEAAALSALALASAGLEDQSVLLDEAAALARAARRPDVEALARLARARSLAVSGDLDTARAEMDACEGARESFVVAELHRARAVLQRQLGRVDDAIAELERAREIASGILAAHLHREEAVLHLLGGRPEAAKAHYARALAGYDAAGDELASAIVAADLGVLELDGDDHAAERLLGGALAFHRAAGDRRREAIVESNLAVLAHQMGDLERADAGFTGSLAVHRALGNRRFEAFALVGLAGVLHERGELDTAGELASAAVAVFEELGDARWRGWALSRRAVSRAMSGRTADARRDFADARSLLASAGGTPWLGALAILERSLDGGEPREASGRTSAERLALRLVRVSCAPPREQPAPGEAHLVLGPDASWFELGGARVDLSRRRAMRRVLARLFDERERAPGRALSTEELVRAGWPGERMRQSSAAARLYAAVRALRRHGLESVLVSGMGGYLLHPGAPARRG